MGDDSTRLPNARIIPLLSWLHRCKIIEAVRPVYQYIWHKIQIINFLSLVANL